MIVDLRKFRPIVATCGAVVAWSVQDILVWRPMEDRHLWQYIDQYQYWHQLFLLAMIVAGVAWLRAPWGPWFAVATWTLANSGLADVLYYWLDLRAIPDKLPWLDPVHPFVLFHPATNYLIVMSALLWLGAWTAVALIFWRPRDV